MKSLTAIELKKHVSDARRHHADVDVRPADEAGRWRRYGNRSARSTTGVDALTKLPQDAHLAFLCHTGSPAASGAAEHFRGLRIPQNVYNVAGGIDAWSRDVDADVPRY